jgi:phosphoribosylglycinamide formyltransferase-1
VTARLVVLVSGSGTTLQALLDASADPAWGAAVVAVGADRAGTLGEQRAHALGLPTFVLPLTDFEDREDWDAALADLMKLVGKHFLDRFEGQTLNTHPALSPSFPGMHGPREALAYGVKVTGCTLFVVDHGIDTGAIVAQAGVPVLDDDTEETLHERIKTAERAMLVDAVGRMAREGFTVSGRKVTIP